ncbi:MAG: GntR family transcriptional regulator [Lachnospiraceae bacterium]|nr:GntR family transcriptional regulator [Lachnospiraceae bacterium]
MAKNNPRELSEEIQAKLLKEIRHGIYKDADKLPPENELAASMGVSRSMIRECLTEFEREGLVNRHKGIGTMINRRIVNNPYRIDLVQTFFPLLEELGYKPSVAHKEMFFSVADSKIAEKLDIQEGEAVLVLEELILADNMPVVYVIDHIPLNLLKDYKMESGSEAISIFKLIFKYADTDINVCLSEFHAVGTPARLAGYLNKKEGDPIVYISEVGFDIRNVPLMYSEEYLVDGFIPQVIVRKKI